MPDEEKSSNAGTRVTRTVQGPAIYFDRAELACMVRAQLSLEPGRKGMRRALGRSEERCDVAASSVPHNRERTPTTQMPTVGICQESQQALPAEPHPPHHA